MKISPAASFGVLLLPTVSLGQEMSINLTAIAEYLNLTEADFECSMTLTDSSCEECTSVGCVWCPGNAKCYSEAELATRAPDYFPECPTENDWLSTCPTETDNFFSDPLYDAQEWVYEILNVRPVWEQGLTGEGVMIQVVDTGVDANHTEFAGKFDVDASCKDYMPIQEGLLAHANQHGTSVASIATANANNDECATGIAPDATLSACVLLDPVDAFTTALAHADISINSWGDEPCYHRPSDEVQIPLEGEDGMCPVPLSNGTTFALNSETQDMCKSAIERHCLFVDIYDRKICDKYLHLFTTDCSYTVLSNDHLNILERGIKEGRRGKGLIFVFAAGNSYDMGVTVNMQGWQNTRYTISVGSVGPDGLHASYSNTGSGALFISGPGGDGAFSSHKTATVGGGCADSGFGTSFANPAVGGAIALVLQANPNLGWRDVQGILASTAQKFDSANPSWTTNAAGYHHSPFYGFGVMDTHTAVEAAKIWENYGPEIQVSNKSGVISVPIGDNPESPAVSSLTITADDFVTESVVAFISVDHSSRGNLQILLESPQGTITELLPSYRAENTFVVQEQEMMTVRSWGEDPSGEWTLTVVDRVPGNNNCSDYPYAQVLPAHVPDSLTCARAASYHMMDMCDDGTVNGTAWEEMLAGSGVDVFVDDATGRPLEESCCTCGGGVRVSANKVNHLISWRLVVYGHPDSAASETGDNDGVVSINRFEDPFA